MPTNQAEFYRGLERAGEALQSCDGQDAARAMAVHTAMQPLLEDTEAAAQLACRLGCSHCCHYPVGVTFPEAMRLADAVRERPALLTRVRAANRALAAASWQQLVGEPCPMLVDDACAIHDARPMPCRALGSLDAAACADALITDRAPPRDEAAWWRGLGASSALAVADPAGSRELRSAVSAILADTQHPHVAFETARVVPGP